VTPTYNQAHFLEQTILSVIGQEYPNLEYIIINGDSTDGTEEIIKKYQDRISHWETLPNAGQSAAINAGFDHSTGDIINWLNSDDLLMPGALLHVGKNMDIYKEEFLCGNCLHWVEGGGNAWGSDLVSAMQKRDIHYSNFLIQPSTWWTRKAYEKVGRIDDNLVYTMDWDYWIRAADLGIEFRPTSEYLSMYRFHKDQKTTGSSGDKRIKELQEIVSKSVGEYYGKFYRSYHEKHDRVESIKKWSSRFRLNRLFPYLLKILLFGSIKKLSVEDIRKYTL
ncbi:MAG: glycosyltransferase, partial [Bacteroidetes bacterium]|nr:glycosyltransferase [Bacteroidota bacterium]